MVAQADSAHKVLVRNPAGHVELAGAAEGDAVNHTRCQHYTYMYRGKNHGSGSRPPVLVGR